MPVVETKLCLKQNLRWQTCISDMHFNAKTMSSDFNAGDTNYTVGSRFERIRLTDIVHIDTFVK